VNRIFIIGFMGSGKSYWGKIWGEVSGLPFFDLDKMIEEGEGKSISEIFGEDGEDHFRKLETQYLHSFADKDGFILSCGGGVPCFNNNMEWMNEHGLTVYLRVSVAVLVQRLMDDMTERPLIKDKDPGKLIGFVEGMLEKRESYYSMANTIISEDQVSGETINALLANKK